MIGSFVFQDDDDDKVVASRGWAGSKHGEISGIYVVSIISIGPSPILLNLREIDGTMRLVWYLH